jgi:hypothetical protein
MVTHPENNYFYLVESDHRVHGEEAANKKLAELVRFYQPQSSVRRTDDDLNRDRRASK